jgi:hypothetical protein
MVLQRSVINLLFAAIIVAQCAAFHAIHHNVRMPATESIPTPSSHLFGKPRSSRVSIFMTDDSKDPENIETEAAEASGKEDDDAAEEKRSVTRTVLLTVPLFCKFVIVLLIKFVTDLVVFPLLFLYRLVGIAKRRFLKMIGKTPKSEKPNGETD